MLHLSNEKRIATAKSESKVLEGRDSNWTANIKPPKLLLCAPMVSKIDQIPQNIIQVFPKKGDVRTVKQLNGIRNYL